MNVFNYSLPYRKAIFLVSTAILATTAQAEIQIGRLPSIHAGDGQVIGAKPNVFLIIDNSKSMTGSKNKSEYDPDGNYLQQTAGALIAALPQLEGKVRLGYSTVLQGTYAINSVTGNGLSSEKSTCQYFKLNGNVDRIAPFIPGLKADLASNPNYLTGKNDFVFNDSGSGYGNTVPRDFRDNYARYIYSWLGAMCMGNPSDNDNTKYNLVVAPNTPTPPYADLKDETAYKAAAVAAKNKNSYPLVNFVGTNVAKSNFKPLVDIYLRILGQVSDDNFICNIGIKKGKTRCGHTFLNSSSRGSVTLRQYPEHASFNTFAYDAYAPTREDNGFPDTKNPLSCRKNYTIMISHGHYGEAEMAESNYNVGVGEWGIDGKGSAYGIGWRLPNGKEFPRTGNIGEATRMYRFLPVEGDSYVREIPKSSYIEGSKRYNLQGSGGKFLLSKMIFRTYYQDLRSNLPNDVSPYIAGPARKQGINGREIPPFWDRKNDTAPWQHMTFFALGFTNEKKTSFASWQYANDTYKKNYSNLDPNGGILESYFRAIEDGTIYNANQPIYDWGRGGYALKSVPMNYYIYKNLKTNTTENVPVSPPHFQGSQNLQAFDATLEMDYAKAGMIGRGGAYEITDYQSIKKVISMIAERIETAMAQGISGGAISGGSRVTASQQAAGGNDSVLFTTYLDQANISGNIFAFKNCPLIQEMLSDGITRNPVWDENNCGKRLWNAATALYENTSKISAKTIVPVNNGSISGAIFEWDNLDKELKNAFATGGNDALGKARVEWLNGKLKSQLDPAVADKLRQRTTISIPNEKQHYKRKPDGTLEKDSEGNIILADPTDIPNLMGEIVYALPKAVDNRGTLPAAHPLNNQSYNDFLTNTVENRKNLVLAGSNDGRLYGFNTANDGENASLAFSFIPRSVILKNNTNIIDFTKPDAISKASSSDGLVNGPFTFRDAQVNGQWGTYVVGTLGEGGDTIYALDISDGRANPNMFKWEVSGRGYGNIMAEPRIIWLRAPRNDINDEPKGKWVVVVPTGYNADISALVVLDLADGTELAKIDTNAKYTAVSSGSENNTVCKLSPLKGNNQKLWDKLSEIGDAYLPKSLSCDNGLGALTVFDADSDSGADFVFAGDLMGHVWKFDLTGFFDTTGNQASDLNSALKVAYDSPLFIAQTPVKTSETSTRQPITTMITIDDGAYGEGSMLYFGTGRMFNQMERGLKQVESFYSIWDIPRYSEQSNITGFSLPLRRNRVLAAPGSKYDFIRYETFVIPASAVNDPKSSLKSFKEIRGVKRIDTLESSDYLSYDLEGHNVSSNNKAVGWIIDFPSEEALERVINRSYSFEDTIFFPTFSPKGGSAEESCSPIRSGVGGDARFYMVDRFTGGQLERSPFDFNHDGTQNDPEGKDGVRINPNELGKNGDLSKLGYSGIPDKKDGTIPVAPAGILIGSGGGDFLSVTGVLEREKQATNKYNCDYSRQVVFPSTVDPVTGNPLVLSSCNRNRYRVWKQPVIE